MKILFSKREDKMYSLEYISTASSYNHVFRITNKLYERDYVFTASLTELGHLREIELENLWFFVQLIDNDERHVFVEATMNDGDFSPTIRRYMQDLETMKDNAFAIANGIYLNEGETENANT